VIDLTKLIAHRDILDGEEKCQYLGTHLKNTAHYASSAGESIGLKYTCLLLGYLHDLGKAVPDWQNYIKGKKIDGGDHSSIGGYYADFLLQRLMRNKSVAKIEKQLLIKFNDVLKYVILAHHGLYDVISCDRSWKTNERISRAEKILSNADVKDELFDAFLQFIRKNENKTIDEIYERAVDEFKKWNQKILDLREKSSCTRVGRRKATYFYFGATVRLWLSLLKDADIYDSINWLLEAKQPKNMLNKPILDDMIKAVEDKYKSFSKCTPNNNINDIRTKLADHIKEVAIKCKHGCYSLDMPVGSGKTMAALRFAVYHAKEYNKQRIFYITAFLSVLEQNASDIKTVIDAQGTQYILEHHSNIIEGEELREDEYNLKQYLKDSWEAPLIMTTIVQFSNTLFKGKSDNLRRFSKLINSVIIIDEVQSLPIKTVYLYNLMTNFITHFMNVTLVHCTATLPEFQNKKILDYPCIYNWKNDGRLIDYHSVNETVFDRVDYYSLLGAHYTNELNVDELCKHIKLQLRSYKSILIILNTKSAVKEVYEKICAIFKNTSDFYYLTTNLCAAHRLKRINELKQELKNIRSQVRDKPLICVSTKLIEAGVNVDFDVVYRSLTSLDSVIQASGRCNRENKLPQKGKVFIFQYASEKLDRLDEFRKERDASRAALRTRNTNCNGGISVKNYIVEYFSNLYCNNKRNSKILEYPLSNGEKNLLDLLSANDRIVYEFNMKNNYDMCRENGENAYKTSFIIRQSFKEASDEFNIIEQKGITAIVQYDNREIIKELYTALEDKDVKRIKQLLRAVQRYTVNLINPDKYKSCLDTYQDYGIHILTSSGYNNDIGLVLGDMEELIF